MFRILFIIFILFSFEVYANKLITGLLKGSSRGSNIQAWGYAGLKAFSENCLQGDQNSLLCQNNRFKFLFEYCENNLTSELCIDTEKFCFDTIKTIPKKENEKFTNYDSSFINSNNLQTLTIKAALTPIQFMGNILLPGSPFGKDNSFLRSDGYLKKRSDEMEKLNEWRNYKSSNPEHYVCDQYRLNYNLGKRLKIKEK
tara:strand:+ start:732 stop:1328 length:597 start_codon:yes stop_codon:yes gene_type:complete